MSDEGQQVMIRPHLQLALSGEIVEGWQLGEPILLEMLVDELGEYVVYDDSLETYGAGATPQEAAEEFASMLIDLYEELSGSEDVLSTHYRTLLARLRSVVSRTS